MRLIPAIDLMGGKCVRLLRGKKDQATIYPEDPVELARRYVDEGAELIHVVDLDGAFTGEMKNFALIEKIAKVAEVQAGGGIRTEKAIRKTLELGVKKVVVSSLLFSENATEIRQQYEKSIIGSFDFRNGRLCYRGWNRESDLSFEQVSAGLREIVVTDIGRDGTLAGPNLELLNQVRKRTCAAIIAAGGVRDIFDMLALKKSRLSGVIVGRSLLEGMMKMDECRGFDY